MTTWTLQDLPNTPEEDEAFKKLTEDQEQQEKERQTFWNHRVIRSLNEFNEVWFEVSEVYYNTKGEPCGYCNSYVGGETMEELAEQMERHKKATTLPILNADTDFNNKWDEDHAKEF